MCFTEAENVKRKSVSEPSWERIDHVYTSTLYLFLSLPLSACRAHLSLCLSPSLCLSYFLLSAIPYFSHCISLVSHTLIFAACLSLSISIYTYKAMQQSWHEIWAAATNFVLDEGVSPQHVAHGRKSLTDSNKVETSRSPHVWLMSCSNLKNFSASLYATHCHNTQVYAVI